MALDPSVILGIKPPEIADPLTQAGKVAGIANALSERQVHQQQLQSGALGIQEQQRQMAQTQAINKAYSDALTVGPDGKPSIDTGKIIQALGAGGQGASIPGVMKGITESQTAAADLAKKNGELKIQQADFGGTVGATVKAAGGNPNLFLTLGQHAIDTGAVDAGIMAPMMQHVKQVLQQDPSGDTARSEVNAIAEHLISSSPAQTKLQSEAAAAAARGKEADTGAAKLEIEKPGLVATGAMSVRNNAAALADPQGLTPEQRNTANASAATLAQTKTRDLNTATNERGRLNIEQQKLLVEKQRDGFIEGGGVSEAAKMAAKGDMDPQTLRALLRRNPGIISQIKQVDPDFSEDKIDSRYATLKEFNNTSAGKPGGQALALNTMIHHANLYMEAGDALKNHSFKPGNAAYNEIATMMGSAPPENAALIARFLASETGKVATGGVPAEGEINGVLKGLGNDSGPDQISGAGKTLLNIAAGRATPLMELAKKNRIDKLVDVIGPDAKQILSRRGFDPETMKPVPASAAQLAADPNFKKYADKYFKGDAAAAQAAIAREQAGK